MSSFIKDLSINYLLFWDGFKKELLSLLKEFKKDWKKLPNLLTEFRLIFSIAPGLFILVIEHSLAVHIIAMIIFLIVAATDLLDGYLARSRNEITELGEKLDPIVDKVLALWTLIALSIVNPIIWALTLFIIVRELSVGFILLKAIQRGVDVAVVCSGKIKTVILTIAMSLLFIPFTGWMQIISWSMVALSVLFSILSWSEYINLYSQSSSKK